MNMKRVFSHCLLLLFTAASLFTSAQTPERCATQTKMHEYLLQHPEALARYQQSREDVFNYISNNSSRDSRNEIVTIPVVFHVIHSGQPVGSGYNIDSTQIISQIAVLNECYRLRNADTVLIPNWFHGRQADIQVEFCLAKFDAAGNPSSGITRHLYAVTSNFDTNIKPATQWDKNKYLNIWTSFLGATLLGYATPPGLFPDNQDGVVLDFRHVGKISGNPYNSPDTLGRTCVHEVGHWLGLYHTFQDSCVGMTPQTCALEGDQMCDTPPTSEATFGVPNLVQNSCHESPVDEYDMWMNYMDYADDDQMHLFTHDQSNEMRAVLSTSRLSIQSSLGCTAATHIWNYSGQIVDANTTFGVPNAKVFFDGQNDFEVIADVNGFYTINGFNEGSYDVYAGKWGYMTKQFKVNTFYNSSSPQLVIPIQNHHYYDDFLMNYNWTTSATATGGAFTRAIPLGTNYQGDQSNPAIDLTNDYGLKCFVTGNSGGLAINDDVDAGTATLISPAMDLTGYTDPYLRYSRWFYDGGTTPDDNMTVKLNSGASTVTVENITSLDAPTNSWTQKTFRVLDFIALGSNMRVLIDVNELPTSSSNVVEGGLDRFEVLEQTELAVEDKTNDIFHFSVYPNPTSGIVFVNYATGNNEKTLLKVMNVLGEEIYSKELNHSPQGVSQIDLSAQAQGIYFVRLQTAHSEKTLKFSLAK